MLCLIAANKTSKVIADELFVAESAVNKHRESICRKLDLHGSHALLNFALEHKSELSDSSRFCITPPYAELRRKNTQDCVAENTESCEFHSRQARLIFSPP